MSGPWLIRRERLRPGRGRAELAAEDVGAGDRRRQQVAHLDGGPRPKSNEPSSASATITTVLSVPTVASWLTTCRQHAPPRPESARAAGRLRSPGTLSSSRSPKPVVGAGPRDTRLSTELGRHEGRCRRCRAVVARGRRWHRRAAAGSAACGCQRAVRRRHESQRRNGEDRRMGSVRPRTEYSSRCRQRSSRGDLKTLRLAQCHERRGGRDMVPRDRSRRGRSRATSRLPVTRTHIGGRPMQAA